MVFNLLISCAVTRFPERIMCIDVLLRQNLRQTRLVCCLTTSVAYHVTVRGRENDQCVKQGG